MSDTARDTAPGADLGPCAHGMCGASAVAIADRTMGESGRLTIITGSRAAALADNPLFASNPVCADHAHDALDDLLPTPVIRDLREQLHLAHIDAVTTAADLDEAEGRLAAINPEDNP